MSKFYCEENDLNWKYYDTANYGTQGGVSVLEECKLSIKSLQPLVDYDQITITRGFTFSAEELVNMEIWNDDEAEINYKEFVSPQYYGSADKVIEKLIREWNKKNPEDEVNEDNFELVENKYGITSIYFVSPYDHDRSKIFSPLKLELDSLDYDRPADLFQLNFDKQYVGEADDWEKLMILLQKELFV